METYYSNGKLLITGEYVVLDGALALALPTKFGQSLDVETTENPEIIWKSFDEKEHVWFEDAFIIEHMASSFSPNNDVAKKIIEILNAAKALNLDFLNSKNGFNISTYLTFPKNWGLGTSSTLINNVAKWANVDAYQLLEKTFGGSGYDIACAKNNFPITYQLQKRTQHVTRVEFNPGFKDHLYFVYLNQKQNSREAIAQYKANKINSKSAISEISDITSKILMSPSLQDFEGLIVQHESIISKIIKQKPVKEVLFHDFKGSIKSLGAWGGDFILATSHDNPEKYFRSKGFETVISYKEMTLDF